MVLTTFVAPLFPGHAPRPAAPGTYAFVDVTVLPMDRERTLTGQTVIIRDGRARGAMISTSPAAR